MKQQTMRSLVLGCAVVLGVGMVSPLAHADPDETPPILTANFDPDTWYAAPKTVTFDCVDPGGGPVNAPDPQTFGAESEGGRFFSATCTDLADNSTTQTWFILIDASAPSIGNDTEPADRPSGIPFTKTFVMSDLSGIASSSCDVPEGTVLAVGDHSVTCEATDSVGFHTDATTITFTVEPYIPETMGVSTLGGKKRNVAGNSRSAVTLTEDVKWGGTVVLAAILGSGDGPVKCKDNKGNAYQKIADRTSAAGRMVVCAGVVTNPLVAGEKAIMTYPAFDGPSAVSAVYLHGADTPGTPLEKVVRDGAGISYNGGRVFPTGNRFSMIAALAYTGDNTVGEPEEFQAEDAVSAGSGANKRTIVFFHKEVRKNPNNTYPDSYRASGDFFSGTSNWSSVFTSWAAENSGPDPT